MSNKFRKKPIVIEAVQWQGSNAIEVEEFIDAVASRDCLLVGVQYCINTLEGVMRASQGDWIIRGINGELYPCKPDIFEKTYEPVDDDERDHAADARYVAFCPKCHARYKLRERRPNGNDTCENGHVYPSADAVALTPAGDPS